MTAQGVRKLEHAEASGTITLNTLARLARGLNCDVQYCLVPRTSLLEQVVIRAQEVSGVPALPAQAIGDVLRDRQSLEALTAILGKVNKRGLW